MIISGIHKNTFIDFPGKVSCILFTAGCNFRCPYCHNPKLVLPPFDVIPPGDIFDFLKKRHDLLDGVVISGGEPTLHNDLADFCQKIKTLDFDIKLDTNGSHPHMLGALIEKARIDYVAMDIKTIPENYEAFVSTGWQADRILESIDLIKKSGIAHEFRTTCVRPFVDGDIIEKLLPLIAGADLFVLQQANLGGAVLQPEFFQDKNRQVTMEDLKRFQKIAAPFVKKVAIR